MSSDEESQDLSTLTTLYTIRVPLWRNEIVTNWLRWFDYLHNQRRIANAAGASRGATPQTRIVPQENCVNANAPYKRRLPKNAYNPTWLAAQSAGEVLLNIQPTVERADMFVHDPNFLAYVLPSRILLKVTPYPRNFPRNA